jgi:hypothetical protein
LAGLVDAQDGRPTVVHCCHPDAPLRLLRRAGFDALSLDLSAGMTESSAKLDQIGEAVEGGAVLFAGLVPTRESRRAADGPGPRPSTGVPASGPFDFHQAAQPLLDMWHRLGLPDKSLAQVVVTPACGLAGATPEWTRSAMALARDTAKLIVDRARG